MSKQIELVVRVKVNEELLQQKGATIKDIISDIDVYDDDVVDGFVITRSGMLGNRVDEFFFVQNSCSIQSIKEVEPGGKEQ